MNPNPNCPACGGKGLATIRVYKNGLHEKDICPLCLKDDYILVDGRTKWRHAIKRVRNQACLTWEEIYKITGKRDFVAR